MVSRRASVNIPDCCSVTPLLRALSTYDHSEEIVSYLLKIGADVHYRDTKEQTVLMYAIMCYLKQVLLDNYFSTPLPLSCLSARSIVSESIPYQSIDLPPHIKGFITLHDPADIGLSSDDDVPFYYHYKFKFYAVL